MCPVCCTQSTALVNYSALKLANQKHSHADTLRDAAQPFMGTENKPIKYKCSAVAEMGDRLATIDMCLWGRLAGSPSNIMWPGPRPTCMPSFTLIRPTAWPEYANVTDRQTGQTGQNRQRSDSIGRTVLQAVAQKCTLAEAILSEMINGAK